MVSRETQTSAKLERRQLKALKHSNDNIKKTTFENKKKSKSKFERLIKSLQPSDFPKSPLVDDSDLVKQQDCNDCLPELLHLHRSNSQKLAQMRYKLHRAIIDTMHVAKHDFEAVEKIPILPKSVLNQSLIKNMKLRIKNYPKPKFTMTRPLIPRFKDASPTAFELMSRAKFGDVGMLEIELSEFGLMPEEFEKPFCLPIICMPDQKIATAMQSVNFKVCKPVYR